jgi:hypothetical protein
VTEVKKASCAVGNDVVTLPDDVQPGDVIECHGVRQRVTYEYGAYALAKVDERSRDTAPGLPAFPNSSGRASRIPSGGTSPASS